MFHTGTLLVCTATQFNTKALHIVLVKFSFLLAPYKMCFGVKIYFYYFIHTLWGGKILETISNKMQLN